LYLTSSYYKRFLESDEALFEISKRFKIPLSLNFSKLIYNYDHEYLTKRSHKYYSADKCLFRAAKEGNLDMVKNAISNGATKFNIAMPFASRGGNIEVFKLFLHFGAEISSRSIIMASKYERNDILDIISTRSLANIYGDIIIGASAGGKIELLKCIITKSIIEKKYIFHSSLVIALAVAANNGNIKIVSLLYDFIVTTKVSLSAYDYMKILSSASAGGHLKLVKIIIKNMKNNNIGLKYFPLKEAAESGNKNLTLFLLNLGAKNYASATCCAAKCNNEEIFYILMNIILEKGNKLSADEYREILYSSASGGNIGILNALINLAPKYDVELGILDYDEIMILASIKHINIVYLMLDKGAKNYNKSLVNAVKGYNREIVELMLHTGACNYGEAIEAAIKNGAKEIIEVIQNYILTKVLL
jgi:ankyrin repeat protein